MYLVSFILIFKTTISGARVILACRDVKKAEQAVEEIVAEVQGDGVGQLVIEALDLASFASIKLCAKSILQKEKHIHLLVNNAGQFNARCVFHSVILLYKSYNRTYEM